MPAMMVEQELFCWDLKLHNRAVNHVERSVQVRAGCKLPSRFEAGLLQREAADIRLFQARFAMRTKYG
jgi:hypothetical protein